MRTRFPPSPTGPLHVGGLRTALYNFIVARQSKGTFILRIEDTDQEREVEGATENIVNGLLWAGVLPDEGVMMKGGKIVEEGSRGPYIQSKRTALYRKYADVLLEAGHAYRCFCTKERLEQMRNSQEERHLPPMYDKTCTKLSEAEVAKNLKEGLSQVLRLKVPHGRTITLHDEIRGAVIFQAHTIDDQVLLKSDGFPTYHLANVIDDHLMAIDLVLRGEEWLSSTPKHLLLYEAFGWTAPKFAHVPLLLNTDKTKLSKRQNAVSVQQYIDQGYLPEALLNFVALLGWNPGTTQELFSLAELVESFSLARVQKAGAVFDLTKLAWLQGRWVRRLSPADFAARILPLVSARFPAAAKDNNFSAKAAAIQSRVTLLTEAVEMLAFVYEGTLPTMELLANAKQQVTTDEVPTLLGKLKDMLAKTADDQWTADGLKSVFTESGVTEGDRRKLLWVLRAGLTGKPFSPGAFEVAALLGKEESLKRLQSISF